MKTVDSVYPPLLSHSFSFLRFGIKYLFTFTINVVRVITVVIIRNILFITENIVFSVYFYLRFIIGDTGKKRDIFFSLFFLSRTSFFFTFQLKFNKYLTVTLIRLHNFIFWTCSFFIIIKYNLTSVYFPIMSFYWAQKLNY